MHTVIEPGVPIALVVAGASGVNTIEGVVLGEDDAGIHVQLSNAGIGHESRVIAIVGGKPEQRYAHATATPESGQARLELLGDWRRPIDQRLRPRYPTRVQAKIFTPSIAEGQDATIIDASVGGLAVETAGWGVEKHFLLGVEWQGDRCLFRCDLAALETRGSTVVLHCRLVALTDVQRAVVEEIVARARAPFEEAQRFLAFRPNDPQPYRTLPPD